MKDTIALEALDLPTGGRKRVICGSCGGGGSKELSLMITRAENGNIYYVCYRASCGLRGVIGSNGDIGITQPNKTQAKPFTGAYGDIPDNVHAFLLHEYGISAPKAWKWTGKRVLIPLLDGNGARWGWVARKFPNLLDDEGPKALVYYDKEVLGYSY